ncbi:MAG: sugar ABC transporter ATP-binding protein [Lachnospiraceae bacterium]|nr:sugar ABC transporter ATP-binding protein [Lachnospiraceae bacterium]MBO5485194.1 sugar ABC transporter ATP-binding protein [Lachnospiraceae bacterium]
MSEILLQAKQISKHFGGVTALDRVDLTIKKGEIHCLMGENGCGKSTLIKIISGFYRPDGGSITFEGKEYDRLSIAESIGLGIQVIYQDMSIFPNLTVAENIAINNELYNRRKLVNWKAVKSIAKEALDHIGIELPLEAVVGELSVADKQLIAIARAILNNSKLIIMDEPTSALTRKEVDKLFKVIRQLQQEGISTLFVSHKLDEVFEIADQFTVFRNGKLVVADSAKNINDEQFVYYMTGRKLEEVAFTPKKIDHDRAILKVENLGLTNGFANISFEIHPGEILGITGLLGSGRTELAKTLFGLYSATEGHIYIDGREVQIRTPMDAIRHKIAYVPEDRLTEGLFLTQSIENNMIVSNIDRLKTGKKTVDYEKGHEDSLAWVKNLGIKLNELKDGIQTLSGGNQQKVVLGKWLETEPRVLILNGPTVGVDIAAKFDIHAYLRTLAEKMNLAILLISDDISEVLNNCNRILIIKNGRIVSEHVNTELDQHRLQELVTGSKEETA